MRAIDVDGFSLAIVLSTPGRSLTDVLHLIQPYGYRFLAVSCRPLHSFRGRPDVCYCPVADSDDSSFSS